MGAVWLSPHTIVMPGRVKPCSGPITWTMPGGHRRRRNRHFEIGAVWRQGFDLDANSRRCRPSGRWSGHCDRTAKVFGCPQLAPGGAALESLRAGDFMDQVAINIDQTRPIILAVDHMGVWILSKRVRGPAIAECLPELTAYANGGEHSPSPTPIKMENGQVRRRRTWLRPWRPSPRARQRFFWRSARRGPPAARVMQLGPAHAAHGPLISAIRGEYKGKTRSTPSP